MERPGKKSSTFLWRIVQGLLILSIGFLSLGANFFPSVTLNPSSVILKPEGPPYFAADPPRGLVEPKDLRSFASLRMTRSVRSDLIPGYSKKEIVSIAQALQNAYQSQRALAISA
jgi:hypothetical protein